MSSIVEVSEASAVLDLEARFYIMATIISEHLRYKQGMHTRLFQCLIPDQSVYVGKSKRGGGHKEHVVPLAYLRDESNKMLRDGRTVEYVAEFLKKNFKVVEITVEEPDYLNSKESGLKCKMPRDWDGTDEFARLRYCKIEWEPDTITNTD